MSRKNIVIHYHDFHPSEPTRHFVDSIVQEIERELPGGANIRLNFSVKDELIKGMLQVGSYAGPLFSVAAAEDIRDVTLKLISQMRRRIDKFKSKRKQKFGIKQMVKSGKFYKGGDEYDKGVA